MTHQGSHTSIIGGGEPCKCYCSIYRINIFAAFDAVFDKKNPYGHLYSRMKDTVLLCGCMLLQQSGKVITRHIWEPYMEIAEDIRHTLGMKALYDQRKETIERIFGSAKEYHGFRYTNMIGKARMQMKAALTFTCINLKKLARIMGENPSLSGTFRRFLQLLLDFQERQNKMAPAFVR